MLLDGQMENALGRWGRWCAGRLAALFVTRHCFLPIIAWRCIGHCSVLHCPSQRATLHTAAHCDEHVIFLPDSSSLLPGWRLP